MPEQKSPKKYSRNEYAKAIVIGLAKTGMVVALLAMPQLGAIGYVLKMLNSDWDYPSRMRTKKSIEFLKRKNLIHYEIKNKKLILYLTEKGKTYYQKTQIESMELPKDKKWDGFWQVVTFDIPEKEKINRRHFSKTLTLLGMYNLEKSVFVYPYECQKQINQVADTFRVSKYVRYMKANHISRDQTAKHFFGL